MIFMHMVTHDSARAFCYIFRRVPGRLCYRAHYVIFRSMMCPVRRAPFWPGTVYILWCYDVSGTPSPFRPGTVYICYDVIMCDGDTEI